MALGLVRPTTSGLGISYARSDQVATDYDHRRYHVYVPPGPAPAQGRPVLFRADFTGIVTHDPASTLDGATGFVARLPYELYQRGWVVVEAGCTGTDDPGTPTQGLFQSPYTGAQTAWQDPDKYQGLSDAFRALQHFSVNAWRYNADPRSIVTYGRSGAAYTAHLLAHGLPSELAYSSSDPISSYREYEVKGCVLLQLASLWWDALAAGVSASSFTTYTQSGDGDGAPGAIATDVTDASATQKTDASGHTAAFGSSARRAHVAQVPAYVWYADKLATSTNYNTTSGSDPGGSNFAVPTISQVLTDGHDLWYGNMLLKYLLGVDSEQASTVHADSTKLISGATGAGQTGSEVTDQFAADGEDVLWDLILWCESRASVGAIHSGRVPMAPRPMCSIIAPTYALSSTGVPTALSRKPAGFKHQVDFRSPSSPHGPIVQIECDQSAFTAGTLELVGFRNLGPDIDEVPYTIWTSAFGSIPGDAFILSSQDYPALRSARAVALRGVGLTSSTLQTIRAYVTE